MKGYLVTGTDTGVGKTLISSALLLRLQAQHARVAGYKPVAAGLEPDGSNEDVELLRHYSQPRLTAAQVCAYPLQAACAPHVAASAELQTLSISTILRGAEELAKDADALVIEGAGGLRVPLSLDPRADTADLFVQLHRAHGLPVVLVVAMRLGCINHALLTAEALVQRGLPIAGWVANCVQADMPYLEDNLLTLQTLLPAPCMGQVPFMPSSNPHERVAQAANCLRL